MIDYAEPLLQAKKNLKQAEDALMKKDHDNAFQAIMDAEAELHKLKNWVWKQMTD